MDKEQLIITSEDLILVTGAAGFIGSKLVESLIGKGFRNIRCFVRPSSDIDKINYLIKRVNGASVEVYKGNLLSPEDCNNAMKDVKVVYHLAAGTGDKSFPNAFMNSVVTTRNLLEATIQNKCLKRFVNISSFSVYSNVNKTNRNILDETCPVEENPELRGDAYCFAKLNQDKIVMEYGRKFHIPYVLLRPGVVLGPGRNKIAGRVGIDTFGLFLHLAGSNPVPITYVDNCAEAILLAGIKRGVDNEVLNIVDDDLPSGRQFLRLYKKNVNNIKSVYIPHALSYLLFFLWERYSIWSQGQLPPVYTRKAWHAYWKGSQYSNEKLKKLCGWRPMVPMSEGLKSYFNSCREAQRHA